MKFTFAILLCLLPSVHAHACSANAVAEDQAAREYIRRIAAALPAYFRYEVTYNQRLNAVVAEPKCVTTWKDETELWTRFASSQNYGLVAIAWTLEVPVPSITPLRGPVTEAVVRLSYDRSRPWTKWTGDIVRSQPKGPAFALPFEIPNCHRRAVNTFSYRTKSGQLLSPEQWRARLSADSCAM